jgi:hypothetical protein
LGVQLVILVDIQVCKSPREASTSSNEGDENLQATLPYGTQKDDLQNDNFRVIGSKILEWYKTQEQPIVQLSSGTIYLCRRVPGKKSSISYEKVVFYDCELSALDPEVHITTKDFGLSTSTISTHLKLPLDKLRAKIPAAMRAYSRELAEEKARNLLEEHGPKKDDRDYQPPADQAPLPPTQDSSKPDTRSNRRKHGRDEEMEKPSQSQKKRKPGKTHTEFTDQDSSFSQKDSFTRTASSSDELCFNLDSDDPEDPEDDPAFSFSAPPATQSSVSTDPHSSTGVRKSSRRKGKASSGEKV